MESFFGLEEDLLPLRRNLFKMDKLGKQISVGWIVVTTISIGLLIIGAMIAFPIYNVWERGLEGKAELKQAEWNRQIAVQEAQAELDSSQLKKQADIIRAEGIAESNKIIAQSLTQEYITWKWVEGLHDGSSEVIYVPTEANLPILEARNK